MNNYEFMSKFKPDTRCIKEFKYWTICIRAKQPTLGDAVIILKREIPSLSEMTPEEGAEFTTVVKWYEDVCKEKFNAVKFNYVVMMMKDFFVHYHAFPRYDKEFEMFGISWKDNDWPLGINYKEGTTLEEDKLEEIRSFMAE